MVKLNFRPMIVPLNGWLRVMVVDAPGESKATPDLTLKNNFRSVELPAASNCT